MVNCCIRSNPSVDNNTIISQKVWCPLSDKAKSMRRTVFVSLMILISVPFLAYGEQPMDILQSNINRGISILKNPDYQAAGQKELQRQELCEAARQVFDFEVFSRLVLASNWKKFTPLQRDEFTDAFARFLCNYYLSKLQERYNDEKLIYVSQELLSDARALIQVTALWKGLEVPVKIRMVMRNGAWKVYDIKVLGISAVLSYREQFREILLKDSPARVIRLIEDKLIQAEEKG